RSARPRPGPRGHHREPRRRRVTAGRASGPDRDTRRRSPRAHRTAVLHGPAAIAQPRRSRHPLLIGGIAFAIVFLLVVGTTVAYLVFRPGGGGAPEAGTSPATESASVTDAGTDGTETSATPTEVEAERCWTPEQERTSDNPSGKLRGGGLQY